MPVETLYGWIRRGRVTARQDAIVAPQGSWLIRADAAELARLRALRQAPQILAAASGGPTIRTRLLRGCLKSIKQPAV